MNKLPSELKLIVSRNFGESDAWDFAELLKMIEEEVQAWERTSARAAYGSCQPKELPTGAVLLVDTPLPHCSSVNNSISIAELSNSRWS